jgi:hypothetical protein
LVDLSDFDTITNVVNQKAQLRSMPDFDYPDPFDGTADASDRASFGLLDISKFIFAL